MTGDRSTDNLDIAAERQEEFNQRGIEAARKTLEQETDPDWDGKHCIDCATIVPIKRRELGKIRCVGCQEVKEARSKVYR